MREIKKSGVGYNNKCREPQILTTSDSQTASFWNDASIVSLYRPPYGRVLLTESQIQVPMCRAIPLKSAMKVLTHFASFVEPKG